MGDVKFTLWDRILWRLTQDRTYRPWAIAGLIVLACIWLPGCATLDETPYAMANATPAPDYPQIVVQVDDPDAICRQNGSRAQLGHRILGCSNPWGTIISGICVIFVSQNPPAWLVAHERLHCKYGNWHR